MRARRGGLRASVALALLVMAVPAYAHNTTFEKPKRLTIHRDAGYRFHGKLTASPECLRGRTIRVWWLVQSDFDPDGGVIDHTTTHANGRWRLKDPEDPEGDTFFATVGRETIEKPGHVHRCDKGVSKVLEPWGRKA